MLVLLVTVDCLRHDCINNSNNYMPYIAEMCSSAHLFENAYATGGRTPYSFPSILGSYYRISQPSNKFPVDKPSVAEVFQSLGFRTIGIQAANPYLTSFFNYDVGFDEFEDFLPTSRDIMENSISEYFKRNRRTLINKLIEYGRAALFDELPGIHAQKIISFAIESLKSVKKEEDIFLWTHLMDMHASFKPPRKFLKVQTSKVTYWKNLIQAKRMCSQKHVSTDEDLALIMELYVACARYVDHNLKRLFEWLKHEGWYDDAIIIITSDHGESFMEHSYFEHPPENLYNEQVRIPLIIKLPKQKKDKTHVKKVSHVDLFPSVLSYLGVCVPSVFCGKANLFNINQEENPVFFCGGTGQIPWRRIGCIHDNWKLVSEYGSSGIKALELYNLVADPQEKANQLENERVKTSELARLTTKFCETYGTKNAESNDIDNEVIKNRLKSLGYVD